MTYSIMIEGIRFPKKLIIYGVSIHGRVLKIEEGTGSAFSLESRSHKILPNGDFYLQVKTSEIIPASESIQMISIKTSNGVMRIGTKTFFKRKKAIVVASHSNISHGGNLQEHIKYLKQQEKAKKRRENNTILIVLIIIGVIVFLITTQR